jgi:hypothetical protein
MDDPIFIETVARSQRAAHAMTLSGSMALAGRIKILVKPR